VAFFISQGVDVIAFSPVVENGLATSADGNQKSEDSGNLDGSRRERQDDSLFVTFIGWISLKKAAARVSGWPRPAMAKP